MLPKFFAMLMPFTISSWNFKVLVFRSFPDYVDFAFLNGDVVIMVPSTSSTFGLFFLINGNLSFSSDF